MLKNKSYIWVSLIILIFGIIFIPRIVNRFKKNDIVVGKGLDKISNKGTENQELVEMGKAPEFELTDQNNKTITNDNFKGKVYVLEFFFSKCPSICPQMNKNMLAIQDVFFGNPNFGIASITIDPEYDTPKILKAHADLLGVKSSNWHFLTGEKKYIYEMANSGFNIYVGENNKAAGGFEHSGLFALIDKNGNIRCRKDRFGNPILFYDGLEKEGVKAIQQDIKILLRE